MTKAKETRKDVILNKIRAILIEMSEMECFSITRLLQKYKISLSLNKVLYNRNLISDYTIASSELKGFKMKTLNKRIKITEELIELIYQDLVKKNKEKKKPVNFYK